LGIRNKIAFILSLLALTCLGLQPAYARSLVMHIGMQKVKVEVANTQKKRAQGLMYRQHLCSECGMFFKFNHTGEYGFWMKNTPTPLAVAFISAKGKILEIQEMQPNSTDIYYSTKNTMYALEMNRNWFVEHAIYTGDYVQTSGRTLVFQ